MNKPNIQIDDLVREMTEEEFQSYKELQASQELAKAEREAKENARASALAKLAALGLTEEEIAAL
jgi:hypothetical protein